MPGDDGAYGYVDIKPCGDRMCGTLTQAFDATGAAAASDNIGKRIVWDMLALGGGSYDSGQVWAPDRDTTYSAKMQLTGRSLAVSGCVLGGLICRAQDWSRVE